MPPQEYGYTPANDDAAEGDWLFPETHTGERALW
jgi:hypothetical protein